MNAILCCMFECKLLCPLSLSLPKFLFSCCLPAPSSSNPKSFQSSNRLLQGPVANPADGAHSLWSCGPRGRKRKRKRVFVSLEAGALDCFLRIAELRNAAKESECELLFSSFHDPMYQSSGKPTFKAGLFGYMARPWVLFLVVALFRGVGCQKGHV